MQNFGCEQGECEPINNKYGDQIFSGYGIREGGRGKLNTAA